MSGNIRKEKKPFHRLHPPRFWDVLEKNDFWSHCRNGILALRKSALMDQSPATGMGAKKAL